MNEPDFITQLKAQMTARYGSPPEQVRLVWSPYRICPLGAHIDHQLGRVMALAIDQGVWLAYVPSGSETVRLSSLVFPDEVSFSLRQSPPKQAGDWGNYARGAALALRNRFAVTQGIHGVTYGRLSGTGLSSSASIGIAYLLALEAVNHLNLCRLDNVQLDQAIENGYLGLNNGILDQSTILFSRKDHLTVIDCRAVAECTPAQLQTAPDLAIRSLPLPASMPHFAILIAFSGRTAALVSTAYNQRVQECMEAAATLLRAAGRDDCSSLLGHVSPAEYAAHRHRLTGPPARRAAHFFTEMQRVEQGIDAWQRGDLITLGRQMIESGWSSTRNYECGSEPLIDLFRIVIDTDGVYGARFSGAGFRGCCIALVNPERATEAIARIQAAYAACQPQLAPNASFSLCASSDGACLL